MRLCSLALLLCAPFTLAPPVLAQMELAVFEDPDGSFSYEFGTRVAIDGTWAAVADSPGHVRLFQFVAGAWVDEGRVQAPGTLGVTLFDSLGDIAILSDGTGATLVVAEKDYLGPGQSHASGGVHIYDYTPAGGWNYQSTIEPQTDAPGIDFGAALAIDGTLSDQKIAFSHRGDWNGSNGLEVRGVVEVWARDATSGGGQAFHEDTLLGRLTFDSQSSQNIGSYFGESLDLSDGVLVVGERSEGWPSPGRVMVYRDQGGVWSQEAEFLGFGDEPGFARYVATEGERIVVGVPYIAPSADPSSAKVYEFNGTSWIKTSTFQNLEQVQGVDVSGDLIVVAELDDRPLVPGASPQVRLYERFGVWSEKDVFSGSSGSDAFESIALDGGELLVGSPDVDSLSLGPDAGSVRFFRVEMSQDCNGNGVPDLFEIAQDGSLDLDADGELDECGGLTGSPSSIATFFGGTQALSLDAGPAGSGDVYFILGSFSGVLPGIPLSNGDVLPVNFFTPGGATDPLILSSLQSSSTFYVDNFGLLDAAGRANASFVIPQFIGATVPSGVAYTATHAFLAIDVVTFEVDFVSNPVQLSLSLF